MTGALVHSACNELARRASKAAGRNYHAEKLATEHDRMRRYYIALYADMERARVAQVPLLIGVDLGYSVPTSPHGVPVSAAAPKSGETPDQRERMLREGVGAAAMTAAEAHESFGRAALPLPHQQPGETPDQPEKRDA